MKKTATILVMLCGILLAGCDSVDCSLNNTVLCHYAFYNAEGHPVKLNDTLSITAYGTDSVLYNRGVGKGSFSLPMSYYNAADTLKLQVWSDNYLLEADIAISKNNTEYFESPDCPMNMMHQITNAEVLRGSFIDSIVIIKPSVNYQTDENIRIYLH